MVRHRLIGYALLAAGILTAGMAPAAAITVVNPSFENPATGPGTFVVSNTNGPFGWSVYNSGATNTQRSFGVWNPTGTLSYANGQAADGLNVGVVFLMNTTNIAEAGLQQTLSATLQLSTQYTLTVDVGNFSPADGGPYDFAGFPGYRVELRVGGTVLASDNNTLLPGEGLFATSTVSFTTGSSHASVGQPLTIRLVNLNGAGTEVNFDDVHLEAAVVPEPSVVIFALTGVIGLLRRRRA